MIKKVICSICNEEVNKAQTLAIDKQGNRACRSHDGVEEKSKCMEDEKKMNLKKSIEKFSSKKERGDNRSKINWQEEHEKRMKEAATLRCWGCYKEAVHFQDYLFRQMVEVEKGKLFSRDTPFWDLFLNASNKTMEKFGNKIPIFVLDNPDESIIKKLDYRYRQTARFLKMVPFCSSCAEKFHIKLKDTEAKKTLDVPLKELALAGLLFNDMVIKPIAIKEVSESN